MKSTAFLLSTFLCLFLLCSCDKKQHAIDNLSDFVEKVEKNAPNYTDEDWKTVNKEYDELITEIDKYEYSSDEAKLIAELKGKFIGIKTKDSMKDLIDGVDKAVNEVKGTIKGIKDGILGNEMQPLGSEADSSGVSNNLE